MPKKKSKNKKSNTGKIIGGINGAATGAFIGNIGVAALGTAIGLPVVAGVTILGLAGVGLGSFFDDHSSSNGDE